MTIVEDRCRLVFKYVFSTISTISDFFYLFDKGF